MANKQINQYTKTRLFNTITAYDLFDLDSTDDSGATFESAKVKMLDILQYLWATLPTFYGGDGVLLSDRLITSNSHKTTFLGGDVKVRVVGSSTDYAFVIEDAAGVEKARLGYDNTANEAVLTVVGNATLDGQMFSATADSMTFGKTVNTHQTNETSFGVDAGNSNTAVDFTGVGHKAGNKNSGLDVTCLGSGSGSDNIGDSVLILGKDSGISNEKDNAVIINNNILPKYADRATAVAALTVPLGCVASNTYLYYNEATFAVEGVRL